MMSHTHIWYCIRASCVVCGTWTWIACMSERKTKETTNHLWMMLLCDSSLNIGVYNNHLIHTSSHVCTLYTCSAGPMYTVSHSSLSCVHTYNHTDVLPTPTYLPTYIHTIIQASSSPSSSSSSPHKGGSSFLSKE